MPHADDFKCWFSDVLVSLYPNVEAGFVITMIALPLLERYLREKSGVNEGTLNGAFYNALRDVFPALPDKPMAERFWQVYRHGLLHQAALSQRNQRGVQMPSSWMSTRFPQPITIDDGEFWVNPAEFAKTIIKTIESDFATYEGRSSANHGLPTPGGWGGATGPR